MAAPVRERPMKPKPATLPETLPERERCPCQEKEALLQRLEENKNPMGASAGWPGDDLCHWYRSSTQTICGIVHEPLTGFHQEAPCPNGNPPCQHCIDIHG
jgi:hypothetical protein